MSRIEGLWSYFSDACRDLASFKARADAQPLFDSAVKLLQSAQRFHLPDAANILEGKEITVEVKQLIHLPFNPTAILYEHAVQDSLGEGIRDRGWSIALVFEPTDDLYSSRGYPYKTFNFFSLARDDKGAWSLIPLVGILHFPLDKSGYEIAIAPGTESILHQFQSKGVNVLNEFQEDTLAIQNLSILLNLANIQTAAVHVPEKLAAARERRGAPPLYEYHVLELDGERWDKQSSEETGRGVRSHFRRGHLRKLGDGRIIFVRAAFVHGSVKGFVDKDYLVTAGDR